jgi:hypothetical protein
MANQAQDKPKGPRLPVAKGADKLMQEGLLAMQRGQWERAEKRLMAAREQLRQLDPMSWSMFMAGHLVIELRLATGQRQAAASVAQEQAGLIGELLGKGAPEAGLALRDLELVQNVSTDSAELDQAIERLRSLAQENCVIRVLGSKLEACTLG